jgi:hypothetical protein
VASPANKRHRTGADESTNRMVHIGMRVGQEDRWCTCYTVWRCLTSLCGCRSVDRACVDCTCRGCENDGLKLSPSASQGTSILDTDESEASGLRLNFNDMDPQEELTPPSHLLEVSDTVDMPLDGGHVLSYSVYWVCSELFWTVQLWMLTVSHLGTSLEIRR